MEPPPADLAAIPAENVRVAVPEFAEVWLDAVRRYEAQVRLGHTDWYTYGVAATCLWVGHGASGDPPRMARAPATERAVRAMPETIEQEVLAADRLLWRRPQPAWLVERPGWAGAIAATLAWLWTRSGVRPLPASSTPANDGAPPRPGT